MPVLQVCRHSILRVMLVLAVVQAGTAGTGRICGLCTAAAASTGGVLAVSILVLPVLGVQTTYNAPSILGFSMKRNTPNVQDMLTKYEAHND